MHDWKTPTAGLKALPRTEVPLWDMLGTQQGRHLEARPWTWGLVGNTRAPRLA
jgi:hypothetical protein